MHSDQLIDAALFHIPRELWDARLGLVKNEKISQFVYLKNIKIDSQMRLFQLRFYIQHRLNGDEAAHNTRSQQNQGQHLMPPGVASGAHVSTPSTPQIAKSVTQFSGNFVFCKSVGRSVTFIRPMQEKMFSAQIYLNEHSPRCNIYLLDYDVITHLIESSKLDLKHLEDSKIAYEKTNELEVLVNNRLENVNEQLKMMSQMDQLEIRLKKHKQKNYHKWKMKFYAEKKVYEALELDVDIKRIALKKVQARIINHYVNRLKELKSYLPEDQFSFKEAEVAKLDLFKDAIRLKFESEESEDLFYERSARLAAEIKRRIDVGMEIELDRRLIQHKNIRNQFIRLNLLSKIQKHPVELSQTYRPMVD